MHLALNRSDLDIAERRFNDNRVSHISHLPALTLPHSSVSFVFLTVKREQFFGQNGPFIHLAIRFEFYSRPLFSRSETVIIHSPVEIIDAIIADIHINFASPILMTCDQLKSIGSIWNDREFRWIWKRRIFEFGIGNGGSAVGMINDQWAARSAERMRLSFRWLSIDSLTHSSKFM